MISLPHGCTVNFAIGIDVSELNKDMVEWYSLVGGTVTTDTYYTHRGQSVTKDYVQYGSAKRCHRYADGSSTVRLHFDGIDAHIASMFLLKFMDFVQRHNLQEQMKQIEQQTSG